MSRFLMIDIGAGTMDILCFDTASGEHFKAVAPSPVRKIGEQINLTRGPLVVSGVEMGGGPVSEALIARAVQAEVIVSGSAAATLHHDMDKIRNWGLILVEDEEVAAKIADPTAYTHVILGDVEPDRLRQIISGLGLPMDFEAVVLCAQDHGTAPPGVSHLDFRHNLFQGFLERSPHPHSLLFKSDEIPAQFNRLRSMAQSAGALCSGEIFVMDSGMAAVTGAGRDIQARNLNPVLVLDIATSHTVAAVLMGDELAGLFEYHTRDITLPRLEELVHDLADGRLDHDRILSEGGHGAYLRQAVGFENIQAIIATGPKRRLLADSKLPITWGAPLGDNMMTGTVGLLEALRRRLGIAPITYI